MLIVFVFCLLLYLLSILSVLQLILLCMALFLMCMFSIFLYKKERFSGFFCTMAIERIKASVHRSCCKRNRPFTVCYNKRIGHTSEAVKHLDTACTQQEDVYDRMQLYIFPLKKTKNKSLFNIMK